MQYANHYPEKDGSDYDVKVIECMSMKICELVHESSNKMGRRCSNSAYAF